MAEIRGGLEGESSEAEIKGALRLEVEPGTTLNKGNVERDKDENIIMTGLDLLR